MLSLCASARSSLAKFGEEVPGTKVERISKVSTVPLPSASADASDRRARPNYRTTAAWTRRTCCRSCASPSSNCHRNTPSRPRPARCRGAAACRCRASSTRRLRTCVARERRVCMVRAEGGREGGRGCPRGVEGGGRRRRANGERGDDECQGREGGASVRGDHAPVLMPRFSGAPDHAAWSLPCFMRWLPLWSLV